MELNENMDRNAIDDKYKWKLEDIYDSDLEYKKDIEELKKLSDDIASYKGKILESDKTLLEVMLINEKLDMLTSKLYVYINMRLHEDTRVSVYQELSGNLDIILSNISEKTSFLIPELLKSNYDDVKKLINKNKELERFDLLLEKIYNEKSHILSEEEEKILSSSSNVLNASEGIFSTLNDADLVFSDVEDENNNKHPLTKGNYYIYQTSSDRILRKNSFNTLYEKYKELNNTFASILNTTVQNTSLMARIRKYKSPLNLHLDGNKIDVKIYYDLIDEVNNNLDKMYKFIELKKNLLNLKDDFHMYDMAVKLTNNKTHKYSYEDAKSIVKDALKVLGDDYVKELDNGFNTGWVDVYENKGKRSGAYSWGTYNVHPYVLLNYNGAYNDVSTLAHEMGHAMHRFYSNKKQDFYYSDNEIFVAEIASTVNETLLNLYMIKNSKDNNEKKYIINEMLDDIKSTIFRQTMFAEFELDIHNRSYNGETLSATLLNEIYYNLAKKYHGDIIVDDYIKYEWSRIPHFYTPFYVYQYATGLSIALYIANNIYDGNKEMLNKYRTFLESGSNDYPVNLVSKMGIDVREAVKTALTTFDRLIDEYKSL